MANQSFKFKFDFNTKDVEIVTDKVLTLKQQIRLLQTELQKTPQGTKEFQILSSKLNDTKDSFTKVNAKSREFFDTLSLIPGPVGDIAGQVDSAIGLLKTFSSFSLSDIRAQFTGLLSDLGGIVKNFLGLTEQASATTVALEEQAVAAEQNAAASTPTAKFIALFTSQVYSQLATQLSNNLFSGTSSSNSGMFNLAGDTISYVKSGTSVTLTVVDTSGNQTIVTVPIATFAF